MANPHMNFFFIVKHSSKLNCTIKKIARICYLTNMHFNMFLKTLFYVLLFLTELYFLYLTSKDKGTCFRMALLLDGFSSMSHPRG